MCQRIRDKGSPNGGDTIELNDLGSNGSDTGRPETVSAVVFMKSEVSVLEIGRGPAQLIAIPKEEEETLARTTAESAYTSTDFTATATA